jgi:hypothetical protein
MEMKKKNEERDREKNQREKMMPFLPRVQHFVLPRFFSPLTPCSNVPRFSCTYLSMSNSENLQEMRKPAQPCSSFCNSHVPYFTHSILF